MPRLQSAPRPAEIAKHKAAQYTQIGALIFVTHPTKLESTVVEFDMKTIRIAIAVLLALLAVAVVAQDDNGDQAETGAGVVDRVQTAVQAGAETVSELGEQVQSGVETVSELGERVASGVETVSELGEERVASGVETVAELGERAAGGLDVAAPIRVGLAEAGDQISQEIHNSINQIVARTVGWVGDGIINAIAGIAEELGDLVRAVALALAVAFVSFVAGMFIGISGKEKIGCAVVIVIGIVVALLVAIKIGAAQGVIAGLIIGVVLPFAGTCLTTILAAAARRWMTGGKSLFTGAYHRLRQSPAR